MAAEHSLAPNAVFLIAGEGELKAAAERFVVERFVVAIGGQKPSAGLRCEVGPQSLDRIALREGPADRGVGLLSHGMEQERPVEFHARHPAFGDGRLGPARVFSGHGASTDIIVASGRASSAIRPARNDR